MMAERENRTSGAEVDRHLGRNGRKVRRRFYWACFWAGERAAERDLRFRRQYPTRQARKAARRRMWQS